MNIETKEYTGKGQGIYNSVAGSLGLASFFGANMGGFGNLFGGGNQTQALWAENSQLKAEKESSNKLEVYNANLMEKWIKPIADEVADGKVREARMDEKIKCMKETHALELELMRKDIALVKQELTCCCTQNASAIAQVAAILGKVTDTIIPISAICPTPAVASTTPATAAAAAAKAA